MKNKKLIQIMDHHEHNLLKKWWSSYQQLTSGKENHQGWEINDPWFTPK